MIEPSDRAKPGLPIRMAEATTTANDAVAELPVPCARRAGVKPAATAIDPPKPSDRVVPVLRARHPVAPVERTGR